MAWLSAASWRGWLWERMDQQKETPPKRGILVRTGMGEQFLFLAGRDLQRAAELP
jgi:hypothetical protein